MTVQATSSPCQGAPARPPETDPEVAAHIHNVVAASRTSFYWAMKLLEAPRREAMFAIYCFCREVDDVADDPGPPAEKVENLKHWREEIELLYQGSPRGLTARGLAGPVAEFGMAKDDFLAVIDGMEMDAGEDWRGPSMARLELYCDRVASAVGRLSVRAFGDHSPAGREVAYSLGQALQLTNILRDIAEDAERGRLYLPDEALSAAGIETREPMEVARHPDLPKAGRALAEVAERRYREAEAALASCDRRAMRPSVVMKAVYHRYLEKLRAGDWRDPFTEVKLSKFEKLMIALRHGLF